MNKTLNQKFGVVSLLLCAVLLPTMVLAAQTKPGLTLQATRVIYPASATGGITFNVTNHTEIPYLMQSRVRDWGSNIDQTSDTPAPFVALPPLQRLDSGDTLSLRIRLMNVNLPQDKESVFALALKAIPAQSNNNEAARSAQTGGTLSVSTQNQLKLFYRPAGLPTYGAEEISRQLHFQREGNQLRANNPTPFWVTFGSLTFGGKSISTSQMVPPFGQQTYLLDKQAAGSELTWQLVSDHGSLTPRQTLTLSPKE